MSRTNSFRLLFLLVFPLCASCYGQADSLDEESKEMEIKETIEETGAYVGMWVTEDGRIRHHLLPDGRYDEARGDRESAYQGSYWVEGNHIEYKDDTGFTADGDFKDGVLYHGGMILYKSEQ